MITESRQRIGGGIDGTTSGLESLFANKRERGTGGFAGHHGRLAKMPFLSATSGGWGGCQSQPISFRGALLRSSLRFLLHSRQLTAGSCCRLLLLARQARVGRSVYPTLPVPVTYSVGSVAYMSSVVHLHSSPFMGNARFATVTGGKESCGSPPMGGPHPRPRSYLAPTVKPVFADGKSRYPI